MSENKIEEIRERHAQSDKNYIELESTWDIHADRATLLAEVDRQREEIKRLREERDALRDAAREYLTTLGGAMKAGKFQMGGSAEMAHFVRQAMQKLDSLVFDRDGTRPAGLEKLHEPLKRPS